MLRLLSFILVLLNFAVSQRVAIIGGGMAGATAAMFIRERTNSSVQIHMYEKRQRMGGRIKDVLKYERNFEVGGGFLHDNFKYIDKLIKYAGFNKFSLKPFAKVAIWDDKEFVFEYSDYHEYLTSANFVKTYGYGQWTLFQEMIQNFTNKWNTLYEKIEKGQSWDDVQSMLVDGDLVEESQTFFDQFIKDKIPQESKMAQDILATLPRAKYNLKLNKISAFSALNSLWFAAIPDLQVIPGGNAQVAVKAIEKADVKLYLGDQVTELTKTDAGRILVKSTKSGNGIEYDFVIVTGNIEDSNSEENQQLIKLNSANQPMMRHMNEEWVFVIEGKLADTWFKRPAEKVPNVLFITDYAESPTTLFQTIPKNNETNFYVARFPKHQNTTLLNQMFANYKILHAQHWVKFPDQVVYDHNKNFFKLDERVCYTGGIEALNMFMETSAMGSSNCVQMMINSWEQKDVKTTEPAGEKKKKKKKKSDL